MWRWKRSWRRANVAAPASGSSNTTVGGDPLAALRTLTVTSVPRLSWIGLDAFEAPGVGHVTPTLRVERAADDPLRVRSLLEYLPLRVALGLDAWASPDEFAAAA